MDEKTTLCGCARQAAGVDPEIKRSNLMRLRRIEGQVRGLQRMIEEERYCPDIMVQVASVQQALRSVSRELLRNHLKHCVTEAILEGGQTADEMCDSLAELIFR